MQTTRLIKQVQLRWRKANIPTRVFFLGGLFASVVQAIFIFSWLNQWFFLAEVIVSFLPYWVGINLGLLLGLLLFYRAFPKDLSTKVIPRRVARAGLVLSIFVLLVCLTQLFVYSFVRMSYQLSLVAERYDTLPDASAKILRVAFFNKLFSNANYQGISDRITALNPDVIAFAEFDLLSVEKITALENYPYMRIVQSKAKGNPAKSALFSRFQIENVETEIPGSTLPYLGVTIEPTSQILVRIIAVHTTAPIRQSYYEQRNSQLRELAAKITDTIQDSNLTATVIMGDFNLTPWSAHFRDFWEKLPDKTKNIGQGRGGQPTWNYAGNPLLRTQLDHIWVHSPFNQSVKTTGLQIDQTLGSDHNLIYTDLYY